MQRANFIRAPHYFNLNMACQTVGQAFGFGVYLVGSSLERRDFGDVDVRAILADAEFDRLFGDHAHHSHHPLWNLMCSSISLYLSKHSDLPVDFQIQRQTEANEKFPGRRHALGLFIDPNRDGP